MLGAALLAMDRCGTRARRRPAGAARRERHGPSRRLPDADRQPRGRHAAGARRAARGRRRRLRGHAPHAGAARPLRRQRRRASATTSTTSGARRRELVERMRDGRRRRARQRRRDAAGQRPGLRARAGVRGRRASAVEVLPGPSAALAALVASGLPAPSAGASSGSCRARRGELERRCAAPRDARGLRVAAARRARTLRRARRARPAASGRGLPRADQAPRGGRARAPPPSWPRATRASDPRGEVVLVDRRRARGRRGPRARPA